MSVARRGEIWLIDLGFSAKVRPGLILNVEPADHERAIATYVPRTTAVRGTRFEVERRSPGFDPGAFDAQGIGGIPHAKLIRRLASVDAPTLARVENAVRLWLGLG